jgi:signal transduction histidine kinase/ligand-binding sensor domain-containing protein
MGHTVRSVSLWTGCTGIRRGLRRGGVVAGRHSILCVLLAATAWVPGVSGAARVIPLDRYQLTRYDQDDGAPAAAVHMTQTGDGFLWAVSSSTLHRFDGTRFERWRSPDGKPPPTDGASAFTAAADNTLWVGSVGGGISALRGGTAQIYGAASGLPASSNKRTIRALLADGDRIIAATRGGLFERQGERWVAFAPAAELADQPIDDLRRDPSGRLWIKTPAAIHVVETDGSLRQLPLPAGPDTVGAGLTIAPDGSVWYWNYTGEKNLCRIFPTPSETCWRADAISQPLFDRSGMLWWPGPERIMRVADVTALDPHDPADLLRRTESAQIKGSGVFESRDGAIWVFGAAGITRLRRPIAQKTDTPSGGLASGDGGSVWLSSYTRGLMQVDDAGDAPAPFYKSDDGTLWTAAAKAGDANAVFTALERAPAPDEAIVHARYMALTLAAVRLDADPQGGFLVSKIAPPGLVHVLDGRERVIAIPELDRGAAPRGAKRDRAGRLWIGIARNAVPLYRQDGERWIANGELPVPADLQLNGFGFDRDDTLWIGSGRSVVAIGASGVRRFGADEGIDIGNAADIIVAADSLWVMGSRGVAVRDGERFATLTGVGGEAFLGTTGLLLRPDGEVWLNGAEGITRIAAREWRQALASGTHKVRYTRLDHWDGLNSPAANGPFPSAAASADGTLWFAMQNGLYRLRGDALPPAAPPPPVGIDALAVDDQIHSVTGDLSFAPGTYRIAVDYSAPTAQRPERTRYRYRFSKNGDWDPWLLAGTQQQIAFNRLDHGRYALEIAASGRDGDWSDQPTRLAFRVLPAFHQTPAFYALAALAAALALALAYVQRVRRVTARIRGEMGARIRERERIARDLHDTLLQGVHGLLLSFQGIAGKLAPDDPLRELMERALDRTEEVMREGRDRVSALRDPLASTLDLPDCLQRHARDLALENKLLCEVAVPHKPRPLAPPAYEELLQVGREAISNALRHSHGSEVRATLAYTDEGVLLVVVDDGVGLPDDAGRAAGHWGIRGMRERAQIAGALLTLRRRTEGGTEVKMFLSAAHAYPGGARAN